MTLNLTDVAPLNPQPAIVTVVPAELVVGLKLVRVGRALVTVNEPALEIVPPGVPTVMTPLEAPAGTDVVI